MISKRSSLLTISIIGITSMVVALGYASVIGYDQNDKLIKTRTLVIHGHQTLEQLELVLSLAKDAETGQRGFVITGDDKYLEPFNEALKTINPAIDQLRELCADNDTQLKQIDQLKVLLRDKIVELQQTISLRRTQGFQAAQKMVLSDYGHSKMAAIRSIVQAMKSDERARLIARSALMVDRAERTGPTLLLLTGLAIITLLSMVVAVLRYLKERRESEQLAKTVAREASRAKNSLDAVLSNMADGLYQLDMDGNVVYLNEAGEKILGYKLDEIKGKNMHDLIHYLGPKAEQKSSEECHILKVLKTGDTHQEENDYFVRKDGVVFPVRYSSSAESTDGKVVSAILSFTDMTESIRNQKLIDVSQAVTGVLVRANDVDEAILIVLKIFATHLDYQFGAFWKPESAHRLRCTTHWINSDDDMSAFVNQTESLSCEVGQGLPGRVWQTRKAAFVLETNVTDEFPRRKTAAEVGLKSAVGYPVIFANNFLGVMEFFSTQLRTEDEGLAELLQAVSEQIGLFIQRKNAEHELILSQERYNLAIQGAHDGIWDWDLVNKTCFYSAQCKVQLGYTDEEIPNDPEVVRSLLHPDDASKVVSILRGHLERGEPYDLEFRLLAKNGRYVWIHSRGQAVRDKDGKPIRMAGSHRDISVRKEAEQRVSEFYSSVSHELRTPLTSIRGSLSLMEAGRAGELPPRAEQLVKIARAESERLVRLINDILEIKKIEAGKLELRMSETKPSAIVDACTGALKVMAENGGIEIIKDIQTDQEFRGDSDRLIQVLTNLVSNAVKYSTNGQTVKVVTEARDGFVRFSVIDQGPGIAKSQLHKLFGLFQQLDSSDSRPKGGTGLGLAISKAIVEQHGGAIGVSTEIGQGATFWFDVPIGINLERTREMQYLPGKYNVLIVEDDRRMIQVLKTMLIDNSFIADQAESLALAKEYLETHSVPDIIILDIKLPDGNGLDLLDLLQEEKYAAARIIVVSGAESPLEETRKQVFEWIKKPFVERTLLAAMQLALRNRPEGRARVLIVEDDDATRGLIRSQLDGMEVDCFEAVDGHSALELIRLKEPDLMILDIGIPPPDGFDIVQILKNDGRQHVPTIIYTASDLTNDDRGRLKLGLTAYLIKSQTSDVEFIQTVRQLLNGLIGTKDSAGVVAHDE